MGGEKARTRCVFLIGATGNLARTRFDMVAERHCIAPERIAPRSTQCHCVVLLLDDGPEMERAPGLAPGKSGFAIRRLDDFGIARI